MNYFLLRGVLVCLASVMLLGCAYTKAEYVKKDSFDESTIIDKKSEVVRVIEVQDYVTALDNLDDYDDTDKKLEIYLDETVSLDDFFVLLSKKGLNVVLRGRSDKDKESRLHVMVPGYSGGIKALLRAVQDTAGVFYVVKDGVIRVSEKALISIKVLYPGQNVLIEGILTAFGVGGSKYDTLSSRVIFVADYKTYKAVKEYFLRVPLSVANINVAVIETELQNTESLGIDWSQFGITKLKGLEQILRVTGSIGGNFTISSINGAVSMTSVLSSLETYRKFRIVQNAALSVVSGEKAKIDVSDKVPYVSAISLGQVGSGTNAAPVQATTFESVDSGLVLNIAPIIDERYVNLNIDIKYQSILTFIKVGTEGQQISRPVVSARNILTMVSLEPGQVMTVGCFRYYQGKRESSGLWGAHQAGMNKNEDRWFEVSALIGVTVTKYKLK